MRPRLPARPKATLDFKALAAQVDYILVRYSKAMIASSVVVSILFSGSLILTLLPGGPALIFGISILIMLIYLAVVIELAGNLAQELGSGEAALYLATPLSRRGYAVAWIIALTVPLGVAYFSAMLIPLLVVDPQLVLDRGFWGMAVGIAGEILYYSLIGIGAALLFKRKNLVSIVGLFMLLIGPLMVMILFLIYGSIADDTISDDTLRSILGIFHPIILYDDVNMSFTLPIIYSLTASTLLGALLLRYASRSLEV